MTEPDVLPGAEPMSAEGGPVGVLALHGFTGCPQSMRPLAEAMAAAGHTVELPRLPGHGTTVDDMKTTTWADWSAHVEAIYEDLAARTDRVIVTGLSMGGTLTLWLASRHPEIAGIVPINPAGRPDPDTVDGLKAWLDSGIDALDGIGSDIAKPGVVEVAYDLAPLAPLLSLQEAVADLQDGFAHITMPTLLITSTDDHVVPADVSDHIAERLAGPVERLILEDSYHVATLDHDQDRIIAALGAFVERVGRAPKPR